MGVCRDLSHRRQNGVGKLCRSCATADIAGEGFALGVDGFESFLNLDGGSFLVEVVQHEDGRLHQGGGVGYVLAGDVGGRSVNGFEDGALMPQVCSRNQTEATDESCAQIADNVAVEIFKQQGVVLIRIHDQLHAGVVDDVFAVEYFRKALGNLAGAAQKQAIGQLHDVGFVDGVDLFAAMLARVFKCEFSDAGRTFFGDDLDAFNDAGDDFMLQSDVFSFGVFADDDEVDTGPFGFEAGKILDGAKVGEEVELLAEGDVDAFEATANGGGDGALERDLIAFDGLAEIRGDVFAEDFKGFGAGGEALPLPLDAGGFEDADDGVRDFGADAVAGDQGYFVGHSNSS